MSFDQLNEILAASVPPPLPVEAKPVVDDDYLLRRFFGPDADHYIAIYNAARVTNPDQPLRAVRRWSWPAALCFLPWALYRKMWVFGGSMTIAGILIALLFPPVATVTGLAVAIMTGALSNRVYLKLATRKLAKLKAISESEDELLALIHRVGGVSEAGAWYGVIVLVAATAITFVAGFNAALTSH